MMTSAVAFCQGFKCLSGELESGVSILIGSAGVEPMVAFDIATMVVLQYGLHLIGS